MGVIIIGITSLVTLVWVLAISMATESTSEKRRSSETGTASVENAYRLAQQESPKAA